MRTVVDQKEIAALWVAQKQEHARASSMSFSGPKIFSYGTCIGQIVKDKSGRRVYLLSSTGYSSTSSMHQGLVEAAIPKTAKRVYVPGCDRWVGGTFFDDTRILQALEDQALNRIEESAISREPKKTRLLREAAKFRKRREQYATMFGVKLPKVKRG